ncbi:MAG: OmpA family protein [Endomicrobiales bacterium]|nr:OmpA family protein [Endomicrobiales bacterium]
MSRRLFLFGVFFFFFATGKSLAQEELETGTFIIGGKLQFEYYQHKITDNWTVTESGYKGINKNYSFSESTPAANSWEGVFGQTLFIDIGFHPTEELKGEINLEAIGDYADRYWMPVNLEHRMKIDDKRIIWKKADISYIKDWWSLEYFRNKGHYNWRYAGDLFDLFQEQFEEERYVRVSGRPVPEGFRLNMDGAAGKLELIYGPEVIWDYTNGFYGNYNFYVLGLNSHFIFRSHVVPYGEEDERMNSFELSSGFAAGDQDFEFGVLYQPFRLGRTYADVEYVESGAGTAGTRYLKKTGETAVEDALGASARTTLRPPIVNEVFLQYTYEGLCAGNKQEVNTQLTKKFTRDITGNFGYKHRKPLLGAVPLVYEGTQSSLGPALLEPRDQTSPFWVGWENRATGWENREARIFSFAFTFDPTPGTWFYKYEPATVEKWNLNPDENSAFSFAAKYDLSEYPSGTDRLLYWTEDGHMIWEGALQTGPWATDGYLGVLTLLGKVVSGTCKVVFEVGAGESPAINSFAYTSSTEREKPITGFFEAAVSIDRKPYETRIYYGQDVWGPEEWHQRYGQTFDKLYMFDISRDFGEYLEFGAGYVAAREIDKKYYAVELGDYDEIRLTGALKFGPVIPYSGARPATEGLIGESPESDTEPPQVSLKIQNPTFSPMDGQEIEMQVFATDYSGVKKWLLKITDSKNRTAKIFRGEGQPPYKIKWDGIDDVYGSVVPEGKYNAQLKAQDARENEAATEPVEISVVSNPKIVYKEITREIKVKETQRGLIVSFTSKVLFESGKSGLRQGAGKSLDELVNLLDTYKENDISVEGHTDNRGRAGYNQKLSEKRARSVASYLIKSGIDPSRITVKGFGDNKPVADNSTKSGREANRGDNTEKIAQ